MSDIRMKELELRAQADKNQSEYNKMVIDSQLKNLQAERDALKAREKNIYFFAVILVVILLLFTVAAFYLNQAQMGYEILKLILFFGSGLVVGRSTKSNSSPPNKESS